MFCCKISELKAPTYSPAQVDNPKFLTPTSTPVFPHLPSPFLSSKARAVPAIPHLAGRHSPPRRSPFPTPPATGRHSPPRASMAPAGDRASAPGTKEGQGEQAQDEE
ncbi:Unknown protein, partial [Striga hermonthica]